MRVKIMPALLLHELLLLLLPLADTIVGSEEETGSRSSSSSSAAAAGVGAPRASVTGLGYASARARDFRSTVTSSPWPGDPMTAATSVYKSADIGGEHLIGGRVTFFTPDDFIRKRMKKKRPRASAREEKAMKTWNSKLRGGQVSRNKRSEDAWMDGDVHESDGFLKMHAFIVRDEDVPQCGTTADKVTKTRYFMCSGVILNENHVLTSATCMNRAQIYEYHIDADLAVLIGALDENSYVIKITHYEIHPRYTPDPNSIHHATNNVAILTLSCPIPHLSIVIPKLPTHPFDDVGHMCCPDRCKLLTVIENSKNHHLVKALKIKHLPSPVHGNDDSNDSNDKELKMRSFAKSSHKNNSNKLNSKNVKLSTFKPRSRKIRESDATSTDADMAALANETKSEELNDTIDENLKSNDDSEATPRNINTVNDDSKYNSTNIDKLINETDINKSNMNNTKPKDLVTDNEKEVNFTNNDKSNSMQKEDDSEKLKENLETEFTIEKNVYCPPLGSPIIANNTLVALIAYTCDDVQSWVEWKYVDVIRNIKWIRREMTKEYND